MLASGEVARPAAQNVVAHDANPTQAVMKSLEARMFQLCQAVRNDATQPTQRTGETFAFTFG